MTNLHCRPLFLLLLLSACALSADADDTLPPDVVARVGGRDLTFDGFCLAAAQQKLPQIKHATSNASTILRGLVGEKIVAIESRRLRLTVTEADIQARYDQLQRDVRKKYRGQKSLEDLMREDGTNAVEFRDAIRNQLHRDRIAAHPSYLGNTLPKDPGARLIQVDIVVKKVTDRAEKVFYVPVPQGLFENMRVELQNCPDSSWIATVKVQDLPAEPITMLEYGRSLVLRLSTSDVHEILDHEIKTGLLSLEGYKLTDAEFDAEIAMQRHHWDVQRTLTSQEALSAISYDDWLQAKYKMTVVEMKRKRFWRGYLALVRRLREDVTDADVRTDYEKKKDTHWGEYILVTEIQIEFSPDNSRFARPGLRRQREALQLAREIPRRLAAGIPFDQVVREINLARDPSFRAQKRRLRPNTDDALLWDRAVVMKDRDMSSPFETLTHVHLLRRESLHPAPPFATIEPVVREAIARRKARDWLQGRVEDEEQVRLRWPLPQRGEVGGLR